MKPLKLLGLALIVVGLLSLVFKGFNYTEEDHAAKIGSLELAIKEKKRVVVPVWAGIAAVVAGAGCLLVAGRR
jgi:hypothetical protein